MINWSQFGLSFKLIDSFFFIYVFQLLDSIFLATYKRLTGKNNSVIKWSE